jgi:3-hydroxybutyryl-CoA dehydrogenase
VIGAGIMGHGIAQLAAMNGFRVLLTDVSARRLSEAKAAMESSLRKLAEKDRISEPSEVILSRISLQDTDPSDVAAANIVIEAVPENLALKREVFAAVSASGKPDLLATNTSQLSITEIGRDLGDLSDRLIGMHFFNPPVIMRLCEIVRSIRTSDATLEMALEFAGSLGRETVICQKDSPGFITTRAYAALRQECLHMVEEGVASAADIDKALRLGFNFPLGPFELSDRNGLDTYLSATTSLAETYGERFRPSVLLRNLVAAGRLGIKSGAGFFDYSDTQDGEPR